MSRWIDANGVSLRYEFSGEGDETIVLVHEAGGSLESWDAVLPFLTHRFRVLRYDQRGFGMSERAKTLDLGQMAADLVSLLESLGVERAHLAGTAVGGSIALAVAAKAPLRVASVTASSPVTGSALPEAGIRGLTARADLVEREGLRPVADGSLARAWPEDLRGDGERFAQYRLRYLANDPQSFAALTRAFLSLDLGHLVPDIGCPATILGCTLDPIKLASECEAFAATLSDGRYVEIESCHFVALANPAEFASAVQTAVAGA
ncbi:MAG: alpha/beta hydrolase [Mesorhizobium sp.]|nr:alpha/beta fold hydrolase [Mesorhizobium sp.]MCO5159521.1 alpha/beta hydrolase [Mesorhizobium sp.]